MRPFWWIPVAFVAMVASVLVGRARRNKETKLSHEPVSGDWLAQARSRDDHPW